MKNPVVVGLLIAVLMAITNPPFTAHEDALSRLIGQAAADAVSDAGGADDALSRILAGITGGAAAGLTQLTDRALLDYHDYVIFSVTTVKGTGRMVSCGAFKQVIVPESLGVRLEWP